MCETFGDGLRLNNQFNQSAEPVIVAEARLFSSHTDEKTEKSVNGEDKGDSGVETQNSESNADDECDPLGPNCYYDKSKSFFDNISCDDTRYESVNMSYINATTTPSLQ